jgi:nucleotide-binding universal stress UspA family protein
MKTFLVPVDLSPVTDKVIETALDFARAFQGRIALLHVIQPPVVAGSEYTLPAQIVEETVNYNRKNAEVRLAHHQEVLRRAGVESALSIAIGAPVPLILEEASLTGADYVIMGSHGHGKLYDFLVGSTASGVLKKARCGVIVIPPADKHGETLS